MNARVEYEPSPEPSASQWDRDADNGDRAVDAWLQERMENRLTREEVNIAVGCLSTYVLSMGRDLKRPDVTPELADKLRKDMRTAGEAMAKLMVRA